MNRMRGVRLPLLLLLLSVLIVTAATADSSPEDSASLGRRLFFGEAELSGRMYTHMSDMPSAVVRCSNCHAAGNEPAVKNSTAPRLNRNLLLQARARRGGPATSYSRASFCTVLRKGVDPAYIVIDVAMPRYRLSDEQCAALWAFLTEEDK